MMFGLGLAIGVIIGVILTLFYAMFLLSGRISREEEQAEDRRKWNEARNQDL